ncbi:kinetochore scaffold 1 isoform X5 [Phycodurus eques]|uniref:kinetochore scaffold 1 isoform X5 n=1 Tax=Phycodurus eques TaxID=693459 RepID=UPI002ACE080A|nr:kinetochore scaffold 1 isoform X5 [Phycodurus eques]
MDPLDPGKNDENSEYCFRRRISSILKAPRKSIFTDPEQQENMVECAKPTEKRNSRRVSFAPANDVLLFAKDGKNASPLRSPFQELMSTAVLPRQNSVQVSIGEDGIQQIMGMEPVISAPLHTSDLNGKATFEPGVGFGEKTVMYCEDDGFMEMTQSHTINIANNEGCLVDSPQKNRTTLLYCGKKTVMSSADSKSLDMSQRYNTNVTRGWLSESHGSNVKHSEATLETNMSQIKTQKVDVNKENQTPTSVYSEMGKSPNNARNIGLSQDMDLTVTHTSHITGLTDDADDPFQCLFPTQEMYSQSDTALQAIHNTKTLQKQTGMTPGLYNTKATFGNRFEKENAEEESFQITDTLYLKNQSFHALQRQRMAASPGLEHTSLTSPSSQGPQINSETQEDCREQAVRFTDGDAHLDVTDFKQSMLESHLEGKDVQKLEDGTITMLEFFQLFSIDFVVHKPRQSVVPGRLPSDTDRSTVDVLKDRLINRPKEKVYESDFEILSEKVEGLNCRMLDLNKPLKVVNKCLWKEMKECSGKEMRSFGVKLKERNNFFRKMSKVRSHEMKEVLYSDLVQTITDGQQKLRSTVDESNEMIKTLDDCICDLEAELAAVEEKGNENKPSLKSLQEEMKKVNETFDDKKRQIYELEVQTKQASRKLSSLKVETKNLQSYIGILNTINEWRFKEKTDNYTVYTFLYDTLHLQLEYKGNGADKKPEQSISHINFNFLLDDEKSQNHASMVHKLLSQYIEGETAWVEKYPTCRHVPKLLHDMSLVVSYCRLLGEELRLLKMWGGLRLNIVEISCVDTQINIVFSSLRRCSKFEVTLSVSLANHLYVLQVHGFKNILGNTTSHQIKQIVKSFTPGKKLLTKIVKKINCHLLC